MTIKKFQLILYAAVGIPSNLDVIQIFNTPLTLHDI